MRQPPDAFQTDPMPSMPTPNRAFLLGPLLKRVSRSFYLTLRVLPAGMHDPVGLAYLLARAADTIADTTLIAPEQRLQLLLALRAQVSGADDGGVFVRRLAADVAPRQISDEKVLLESLGPALAVLAQLSEADRVAVRDIVSTLSTGMEFDLRTFPDEHSGRIAALRDDEELDRYTYLVAGCVGEFWTRMTDAHVPGTFDGEQASVMARGIRFGKALQMTNILRDCGKDLRIGRCYLPATMLAHAGLTPAELLLPDASRRARPLLRALVERTLAHFRAAVDYMLAIPPTSLRLRLACAWPILIGLETLRLLVNNDAWLDPARVSKLPRGRVYRIVAYSSLAAPSNRLLRGWAERLIAEIDARLEARAID